MMILPRMLFFQGNYIYLGNYFFLSSELFLPRDLFFTERAILPRKLFLFFFLPRKLFSRKLTPYSLLNKASMIYWFWHFNPYWTILYLEVRNRVYCVFFIYMWCCCLRGFCFILFYFFLFFVVFFAHSPIKYE